MNIAFVILQVDVMLPSKLKALNDYSTDESSDNNGAPVKITKEILVIDFKHSLNIIYIIAHNRYTNSLII